MRIITYSDIMKRKLALESSSDPIHEANCELYKTRAKKGFNMDDVVLFMNECAESANSSTSYLSDILFMVENVSDSKILDIFENNILPQVKSDMKINISNIDESTEERINEQLKINKTCDRIIENHNMIKNRIKNYIKEDIDIVVNKCCSIVSENKLPLHGKVCVAIEEAKYVMESNNREYDSTRLVSLVLDYFSIKEKVLGESANIMKALKNNNYIYEDVEKYLSESPDDVSGSPTSAIEIFKLSPEKNADLLKNTMNDILKVDNYNLKFVISAFFDLLKEILISSDDESLCSSIYKDIIPAIYENIFNNKLEDPELKDIVSNIRSLIITELEISNTYIKKYNDNTVANHMLHYSKALEELYSKFEEIENISYTKYNIECMSISVEESDTLITLDEFKIFKFQNLINMSRNIDKFFKEKLIGYRNKIGKTAKKIKSKIFGEATVYDALLEDGSVDFIVCTIESNVDSASQSEISDYCKTINESILYDTDYICYYTANERSFDIHIKDNCMVSLSESELKELEEYTTLELKSDIEKILELANHEITSFDMEKIVDIFTENQTVAFFRDFVEVCSYANIDKEIVEQISEAVFNNKSGNDHLDFYHGTASVIGLYQIAHSPIEVQMEAMDIIYALTEAKDEDEDDEEKKPSLKEKIQVKKDIKANAKEEKKEAKEKDDKNPLDALKLNNIQLYIQGLKKKMKDMSAKEQEICRQADSTFNNFAKACKNALISDRREAIIKGSVIPSFSKCIKIGVTMAGIFFINPIAAVVTAIGGLAMSKKLTKKERALLLDELEVELEMIEKEIQNADNKNQMKKERALMMQKKNLQRQYQRIKYNIRLGKDLIPSSSMGIKDTN